MEITINRFWSIDDEEGLSRASILLKRPRIDGQIANLVFDFIWTNGCCLVESIKKITKEELDSIKPKMDFEVINQFPFPASFDAQKYSGDNGSVEKRIVNFVVDESSEAFVFRDKYLEHYGA